MSSKKLIVVLGMHRSGTSALTRGLQALGATLGDNLMAPAENENEKGFWEDLDFYSLNESLLTKAGSAWHYLGLLQTDTFLRDAYAEERLDATSLLRKKLANANVFAFKDPRTAILLPFWQSIFNEIGVDHRYVIALRNPLDVAASLQRRNGFDTTKGLMLWAKHMVSAVEYTNAKPRLFVSFESLLEQPIHELTRMAQILEVPAPNETHSDVAEYVSEFLDPTVRQTVTPKGKSVDDTHYPAMVSRLNNALYDWSLLEQGGPTNPDNEVWQNIKIDLDSYAPLFLHADTLETQIAKAEVRNNDLEAEQNELFLLLAAHRDKLAASDQKLMQLTADNQRKDAEARDAAQAIRELRQAKIESDKRLLLAYERIDTIFNSASWRITAPLRGIRLLLESPKTSIRTFLSFCARGFSRLIPLPSGAKQAIVDMTFSTFPYPFRWSATYKTWRQSAGISKKKINRTLPKNELSPLCIAAAPDAPHLTAPKIIIAIHDLRKHGAQFLALNMARTLKARFGYEVAIVAGEDGALRSEFSQIGAVKIVNEKNVRNTFADLTKKGFANAIANSSATGWLSRHFAQAEIGFIGLVHELPSIIKSMRLAANLKEFDTSARYVVFPSNRVRDIDSAELNIEWRHPTILPQGLYKRGGVKSADEKEAARLSLNALLGLPVDARIILGAGYADHRKGIDLFVQWSLTIIADAPDTHAIWIGDIDPRMKAVCDQLLENAGSNASNIHFTGFIKDTNLYYAAADLYALSSREDPFPSTALEALAAGTPVIMAAGTGGIEDIAEQECVIALKAPTPGHFRDAAAPLIGSISQGRTRLGKIGRDLIQSEFGFASYIGDLARLLGEPIPKISVVIPNYNYAHFLKQRLQSVLNQTLPPWEIIFLDDASSDYSISLAETMLFDTDIRYRIIRNEINSGSVYSQWRRGAELAQGDFIWIAEADDWSADNFLQETAVAFTQNDDVVLAYSQSNRVDEKGVIAGTDYLGYVADVDPERWRGNYRRDGREEILHGMSVKNTIPNASAVIFRAQPLQRILAEKIDEISRFRVAGDWFVYVQMLRQGSVAFNARSLNFHRRHDKSVTISRFGLEEFIEIAEMQAYIAREFGADAITQEKAHAYLQHLARENDLVARYGASAVAKAMAA